MHEKALYLRRNKKISAQVGESLDLRMLRKIYDEVLKDFL